MVRIKETAGNTALTVAVIIPFYNGSQWIERAIKSVLNQTVQADEFVIVNDGSRAEEREALGRLAEVYSFRIIDKDNGGQGSARNAGVAATTSSYISLLDQDDFYLPKHIEDLIEGLPQNDPRLGFVYADLCAADGAGNIEDSNLLRQQPGCHPKRGQITRLLRTDMFVLPSASLIARVAFDAVSGFDEQFTGYEDDDLFIRLFRAGFTNYFLDIPVTVWCMHTGSTSWSIKMSRSRYRYFEKLLALFPDDAAKHHFYFRDCLAPRFGPAFIVDALRAARPDSENRSEINGYLYQFSQKVYANSTVRWRFKMKLAITIFLLKHFPPPFINAVRLKAARLPLFRHLVM